MHINTQSKQFSNFLRNNPAELPGGIHPFLQGTKRNKDREENLGCFNHIFKQFFFLFSFESVATRTKISFFKRFGFQHWVNHSVFSDLTDNVIITSRRASWFETFSNQECLSVGTHFPSLRIWASIYKT